MIDKNPFEITEFKGVNRGSKNPYFDQISQAAIPFSYALNAENIVFKKEGGFQTRPPLITKKTFLFNGADSGIVSQHWKIARLGNTYFDNRWLYLSWDGSVGRFYDTTTAPAILKTITGCKYASVINIYGRLYISPLTDLGVPLTGSDGVIWLYDGTTFRKAGGTAPTGGTLTITDVAVGGANVTAGLHIGAIAFETDSGYVTPPGPATRIQVTIAAGGGRAARFANVDTGPAGTVARHLLLTKTITNYDGIQDNWELFFALKIPDNVTTTGDVVVPDTGLVNSADYLLTEFSTIPACAAISVYRSHLLFNGANTDRRVIYVSKPSLPETIDQTEDYIQIFDGIPSDILNSVELRGLNYIFKETCTYVTREDPSAPTNSWEVNLVDSGVGISPQCIAVVMANPGGLVLDNLIVGGMYGIYIFSGTYQHIPLSVEIQAVFDGLTRAQAKDIRIHVDPIRRRFYILFGGIGELWMCDYFNGLNPGSTKWAKWVPYANPEGSVIPATVYSIFVDPNNSGSKKPDITLSTGGIGGNNGACLAEPDESSTTGLDIIDGNNGLYPWLYETGFTPSPSNSLYSFAKISMRALSLDAANSIDIQVIPLDSAVLTNEVSIILNPTPQTHYAQLLNTVTEQVRLKISGTLICFIDKLVLWASERAQERPR